MTAVAARSSTSARCFVASNTSVGNLRFTTTLDTLTLSGAHLTALYSERKLQGLPVATRRLTLTWRTLDLDGARLRVERQLLPIKGGVTFGPPKSRRSERTIALDPATVDALRHHRETQKLERDLAGAAYTDRDLAFCDELGGPINPQRLTEWFGKHRKAAGIPTGHLHTLRDTAATLALTATPPGSPARPSRAPRRRPQDGPGDLRAPAAALGRNGRRGVAAVLADKALTDSEVSAAQTAL